MGPFAVPGQFALQKVQQTKSYINFSFCSLNVITSINVGNVHISMHRHHHAIARRTRAMNFKPANREVTNTGVG